jgi:hypothetical protein
MKKRYTSHQCYQTMAANGRSPYPVFVEQKTTWMRFLLFCLYGREYTAVAALQPIRVADNHRFPPHR